MVTVELWDQQKKGVELSLELPRKIIAIDVGGGKTLTALKIIEERKKKNNIGFCVVLCPKSSLPAWEIDISEKSTFTYSVNEIDKTKDFYIFTFSNIQQLFYLTQNLSMSKEESLLIVDEAHMLASSDSVRSSYMRGVCYWDFEGTKKFDGIIERFSYAVGLTATLMINHVEDIFYLINSFFTSRSGRKFFPDLEVFMQEYTYREQRTGKRYNQYKRRLEEFVYFEVVGFKNLDKLSRILEPLIYRHSIDYKPNILVHKFRLSDEEMEFYYEVGAGIIGKKPKNLVSKLPLLQQAVNGSVSEDGKFRHGIELSSKERELVTLLNSISDRKEGALVFTQFKKTTFKRFEVIKQFLHFENYHFLSGDSKSSDRHSIVVHLAPQDVLFSTKAGGTSLNFRAVNNVIMYDLSWSVGEFLQNMGRITRSNSTYTEFNVYILIALGTIDEYKYMLIQSNLNVQKEVFGGFNFADVYFAKVRRDLVIEMRKNLLWGAKKLKKKQPKPTITCSYCGNLTDPSVSSWEMVDNNMTASECLCCWDSKLKRYVLGCAYNKASIYEKEFADKFISM